MTSVNLYKHGEYNHTKCHLFQLLTLHFEVDVDFVEFSLLFRRVKQTLALLHEIDPQLEVEVLLLQSGDLLLTLPHRELRLEGGSVAVQRVATTVHLKKKKRNTFQFKCGSVSAY